MSLKLCFVSCLLECSSTLKYLAGRVTHHTLLGHVTHYFTWSCDSLLSLDI